MGATIFLDIYVLFYGKLPFDFYFNYIIYFIFIAKFIVKNKTIKILPKWFLYTWLFLMIVSLVTGNRHNTLGFTMYKQFIGISFSSIAFYTYFKHNNFDAKLLFNHYLKLSYIVSLLGIGEEFLHLSDIHLTLVKGTSIGLYRVYSIMAEPYYLAVILAPALFYYLSRSIGNKTYRSNYLGKLLVITICFLLTFSTAGLMSIFFMVILILYNKGYFSLRKGKALLLPMFIFVFGLIFLNAKDSVNVFKEKIEDTYVAFTSRNFDYDFIRELNSSTFALFTNFVIAEQSFMRNPISGSGLGSHVINYENTFTDHFDEIFLESFGSFNKQDANSLFLRLMSETGVIGLILIFLFLIKFFCKRKWLNFKEIAPLVLMNQGIFIMIVVRLIRTGNYIGNGFFFFFFLYWATWKICKNYEKTKKFVTLNGKEFLDNY